MKKTLAILLTLALAVGTLSACGGKGGSDTAGNTDAAASDTAAAGAKQLAVQIGPDPETIDPALNSAIDGANMILHSFEALLIRDEQNNLQPGQAETWEKSEDGLTWTFHLRDGLKWSDGTPLTAGDFVYAWQRVCDPETAAPYAETVLGSVKGFDEAAGGNLEALGVSAPDDKTLVVELAEPCTYFESLAALPTLSPIQKATVDANGDSWATAAETYISNGSLHVTEWVPGSHIIFSKNPNYWNADAVKLDSVKFVLMEDANASYSAYKTGEVLFIKDVPTEEIPSLRGSEEFFVDPIMGTYYLNLNTQIEPFNDPLVRKAMSLAIDRDYVANTLMQGTYTPAYNMVGPGWLDTDGSQFMDNANGGQPYISKDHEANLAEAAKLMTEAGYPDGEGFPTVTYSTNDMAYHKPVAEYLQQAWAEIGITMNVDIVEWSSFTPQRRAGDYQMARNGWSGDHTDPSNILELFITTNGNNDGKFSNADFDAAMEETKTVDVAARSAALHKAEDILMDQMGGVPLAYYNDFWLQSPKITGSWHSPNGFWFFMYADITE